MWRNTVLSAGLCHAYQYLFNFQVSSSPRFKAKNFHFRKMNSSLYPVSLAVFCYNNNMHFMLMLYLTGSEKCLSDVARWEIKKAALGPSSSRFNYYEYLMAAETSGMHYDAPKNATVVSAQHSMPDNHPSPRFCPLRTINNHWTKPCDDTHIIRDDISSSLPSYWLAGIANHSCQLSEKRLVGRRRS